MKNSNNKEDWVAYYARFNRENKELGVYFLAMVFFMTTEDEVKSTWFFRTVVKILELSIKHNMPEEHTGDIYSLLVMKAKTLAEWLYVYSKHNSANGYSGRYFQGKIRDVCSDPCELLRTSRKYISGGGDEFIDFIASYTDELISAECAEGLDENSLHHQ